MTSSRRFRGSGAPRHRGKRTPPLDPQQAPRDTTPIALSPEEESALLGTLRPLVSQGELEATAEAFRAYLSELIAWNARINLVAAGDRDRLVRRHVVESLACIPLLDELGGSSLMDLGSGGGFPGIPIKIVRPALHVTLVESRRMKSLFLRHAVQSLALRGASVWQSRVESLSALPVAADLAGLEDGAHSGVLDIAPPAGRPLVDLLTSRAVAELGTVAAWVAPLVRPGGFLVTFKGKLVDSEIETWRRQPGGWELARVSREVVPHLTLVALRRTDLI